jgi:xyloglucan-specific endo-beta-1,4-glucanase
MNGAMRVYSFVAPSNMNSFSGDAKEFFKYLERNEDYPSKTQNLIGEPNRLINTSFSLD